MPPDLREEAGRYVRRATIDDVDAVVELVRRFYAEDGYPFDAANTAEAVCSLIDEDVLGAIWVADPGDGPVGYVALTLGFSLEFMGRDGFVDDLYLSPAWRGRGLGRALLDRLVSEAGARGVRALHLEVGREKREARALYRRVGFEDHDRILMTRELADETEGEGW